MFMKSSSAESNRPSDLFLPLLSFGSMIDEDDELEVAEQDDVDDVDDVVEPGGDGC